MASIQVLEPDSLHGTPGGVNGTAGSGVGTPGTPGTPGRDKSPQRLPTDPTSQHSAGIMPLRIKKRIIVCCDGTWQDGISTDDRRMYTNVLRIARTINTEDARVQPPIPQIVFYQSGIGSGNNFFTKYVEGTTGGSLADKVEEAYAFIAHNFYPGDEIFLFGFSRGAYTARMVAMFIGAIGVLDRKDMDHFAHIFLTYQKVGECKESDVEEKRALEAELAPFTRHDSPGKKRADSDDTSFSVKCIGVFDTVGSLGLPEELTLTPHTEKMRTLFGFPNKELGEHVERAYQALALNETRKDFNCAKFYQTEAGKQKKQVLKQCWFTGCHSDIGGGYRNHDLSDLTLTWMTAHVGDILSMDLNYLGCLLKPVAPWGAQKPHDSIKGFFTLAHTSPRSPGSTAHITNETIHTSALHQIQDYPELAAELERNPKFVAPLLPLEEEMKVNWPYNPDDPHAKEYRKKLEESSKLQDNSLSEVTNVLLKAGSRFGKALMTQVAGKDATLGMKEEGGVPVEDSVDVPFS